MSQDKKQIPKELEDDYRKLEVLRNMIASDLSHLTKDLDEYVTQSNNLIFKLLPTDLLLPTHEKINTDTTRGKT